MMEDIYELLNDAEMDLEGFEGQKLSDYESRGAKKQVLKEIRKMKNPRACLKNHSRGLHSPLCGECRPNLDNIARYAFQIWDKFSTNCEVHLTESIFQTRSRTTWKKTLAAAACACVMIGMGTISAAAGLLPLPDVFQTILGIRTDEELKVANTIGASTNAAAEDCGYKVSAEGIIGDGKNMGIVFKIERPDGSALLDSGAVPADVDFIEINTKEAPWLHSMAGTVAGSNKKDCIEYYIAFTYKDSAEDRVWISLEGMRLRDGGGQIEVPGKWEFDIPFKVQDLSVDLAAGQKIQYGNSKGTIDELRVSPIGFTVRVTTSDTLTDSDFIDMPMEIHFKNGKTAALDGGCGPEVHDDGTWSWREEGVYGEMILLDHIESVVIGDTEFAMK